MNNVRGRRRFASALAVGTLACTGSAQAEPLDLERLTGPEAIEMMERGQLTSVQLTRAYIARIGALNKSGPGLNAVSQFNRDALKEAAKLDAERAAGTLRGPAHGLPILLKDLIDVQGMYTSNGNFSLRNSFPATDSGIARRLKEKGVVILGKLGLSEWANSFGNQPSGFSNLIGQVLNGIDADQNVSGSSSGTGAAAAAALSTLAIGTETSGSIISPSRANGLVGLRPTVGLVPGYGIGPISASQDIAGPMERTVADVALTMASIADPTDPVMAAGYEAMFGAPVSDVIPPAPPTVPDYLAALDLGAVSGKRIGYNGDLTVGGVKTPLGLAVDALTAAGAIMVARTPKPSPSGLPALPSGYEQHKSINGYYARLGPDAPIGTLEEEVADNIANSFEALKFGNGNHLSSSQADISPGGANETAYRTALRTRKAAWRAQHDGTFSNDTSDPADDIVAQVGSITNAPQVGYPQITIPMGYTTAARRTAGNGEPNQYVDVHGPAYSEATLISIAYVIEQATKKRQPASLVNPSMYRCAKTVPAPPFASRGACNPDHETIMAAVGTAPTLPFALEEESIQSLQERMTAGTLSAETLTKAYLARIARTNTQGPALQAVRAVDLDAIGRAAALDRERERDGARSPLHGIPVLVDDSIDVSGLPTTAGSIALQGTVRSADAKLVDRLEDAGAIVLGKTNVSEFNGVLDANAPEGYSSLGGQVLLPSDTDKTPAGSSAGSAAATAAGLAAATIGLQTSPDTAQLIAPSGVAGVVGLKPTVGRVSRTGVLGVARTQDAPGPIGKTVRDVATTLQVIGARDSADGATAAAPTGVNYLSGLTTTALRGKRVGVVSSTTAPYPDAVAAIQAAGATTVTRTPTAFTAPPSIVLREFERDLEAYLGTKTLAQIVQYNTDNAVEGLKYRQGELTAAEAVNLSDSATQAGYVSDRDTGRTAARAYLDALLDNGTPSDTTDDVEVLAIPATGTDLPAIADRAGYPMITVPAGYGTGGAGRNPIGVVFVGKAFTEPVLLADAFAFEQATKVRVGPSRTNPSMFRCVDGSAFFSPHHCHPGDLRQSIAVEEPPVPPTPAPPTPTPTPTTPAAPTAPVTPASTVPVASVIPVVPGPASALRVRSGVLTASRTSLTVTFEVPGAGAVRGSARTVYRKGRRTVRRTLGTRTGGVTQAGTVTFRIPLGKAGRSLVKRASRLPVTFVLGYTPTGGTRQEVKLSRTLVLRTKKRG